MIKKKYIEFNNINMYMCVVKLKARLDSKLDMIILCSDIFYF